MFSIHHLKVSIKVEVIWLIQKSSGIFLGFLSAKSDIRFVIRSLTSLLKYSKKSSLFLEESNLQILSICLLYSREFIKISLFLLMHYLSICSLKAFYLLKKLLKRRSLYFLDLPQLLVERLKGLHQRTLFRH